MNKVIVILHQVYSCSCVYSIKYWTNGGLESTQSEVWNGIPNSHLLNDIRDSLE